MLENLHQRYSANIVLHTPTGGNARTVALLYGAEKISLEIPASRDTRSGSRGVDYENSRRHAGGQCTGFGEEKLISGSMLWGQKST